ncbi:hypothetical protein D3C71_1786430 [compost metagenome]
MPGPVSRTDSTHQVLRSVSEHSTTAPRGLNLMALLITLASDRHNKARSPRRGADARGDVMITVTP